MPEVVKFRKISETREFLDALTLPDEKVLTWQTVDDKGEGNGALIHLFDDTFEDALPKLRSWNEQGAGVFVSLNRTDGGGRKGENIVAIRAVCADLDGSPLEPVHECALKPHLVVESSPGRYHLYWLVDDLPMDRFVGVMYAIAKRFDGDPAIAKLTHCARLPGFYHNKGERFRTKLIECNDHKAFTADEIVKEFPPEDRPHKVGGSAKGHFPKGAPLEAAKAFVKKHYLQNGLETAIGWRGNLYSWNGSCYEPMPDADLTTKLYEFLDKSFVTDSKGKLEPFNPSRSKVGEVQHALLHGMGGADKLDAPFWIPQKGLRMEGLETNMLVCRNGMLDLNTGKLEPLTPLFFTTQAVPFDYDPKAECPRWKRFLEEVWPEDIEAEETLAEIFGLLLTSDTSDQKLFMLIGPKRSGKGTIGRVLTALLGRDSVVNPTLSSLGGDFGLQPLINKRLGIITDARLGPKSDVHRVAERLLSISGEDGQTINRKHKDFWTGRLAIRFLMLSNELPAIKDVSGALPSRFVIVMMTESFFGREDKGLTAALMEELPGILNWSLEGLKRLRERGYFEMPQSSKEAMQQLEDIASPVKKFVREWCEVGPGKRIPVKLLYAAWKAYCEISGNRPGADTMFGRDFRAAFPSIHTKNRAEKRVYVGIELNEYGNNKYGKSVESDT